MLQEKPADKLLTGLQARAIIDGRGPQAAPAARPTWRRSRSGLEAALKPLPYEVIANEIKEAKASAELLGEGRFLGYINEVLQPTSDKTGALSSELAPGLVSVRYALVLRLPLKQTLVDTYGAYLAATRSTGRTSGPPEKSRSNRVAPIRRSSSRYGTAAWTPRFSKRRSCAMQGHSGADRLRQVRQPTEHRTAGAEPAMQARLPTMKARSKGFSDLQSNVDSPEANEVKQLISTLPREQYKPTVEELILAGNYTHGTHVAGITMEGNPYARLLVARMEFGNTLIPDPCPSLEQTRKDARATRKTSSS